MWNALTSGKPQASFLAHSSNQCMTQKYYSNNNYHLFIPYYGPDTIYNIPQLFYLIGYAVLR